MGQVAFDTLQVSEELETAGISRKQAKAISLIVRKFHEVADVATKADIVELKHEIAEVNRNIVDVRKDMEFRFEKADAQIADVRKDMVARFEKSDSQMQVRFEKTEAQIALIRKDVEHIATELLLKLGGVIVVTISAATAVMKYL